MGVNFATWTVRYGAFLQADEQHILAGETPAVVSLSGGLEKPGINWFSECDWRYRCWVMEQPWIGSSSGSSNAFFPIIVAAQAVRAMHEQHSIIPRMMRTVIRHSEWRCGSASCRRLARPERAFKFIALILRGSRSLDLRAKCYFVRQLKSRRRFVWIVRLRWPVVVYTAVASMCSVLQGRL